LRLFATAFEALRPALSPAVVLRSKPSMVDASVLVDSVGQATLIGICNYRTESSVIEFDGEPPRSMEPARARLLHRDRGWAVEVPARDYVALFTRARASEGA
jgi:hypothetical protein